ncbi:hypothetical protein Ahy_B03g068419 isoform A [Arachis hypogaea]|uniref:Uncharacterized protein n=1 Tax=Arachis hypogaea TaxID=3818 RepID=A0A445A9R5_ARAHY|nr:hypothetical protein Ahy_B03g068419 isoform A [Arachis hypogaea]
MGVTLSSDRFRFTLSCKPTKRKKSSFRARIVEPSRSFFPLTVPISQRSCFGDWELRKFSLGISNKFTVDSPANPEANVPLANAHWSFQNKGFWTVKGSGHINDRETTFDNPSKVEPKRPHQWFVDSAEVDLFPNKKQAVEDVNGKSSSGFSNVNYPPWDNSSGFSVSNIVDQLFGSETRQVNVIEKNVYVPAGSSNVRSRAMTNQYGDNSSIGLSISHSVENSEAPLNYGGVKKVKVSQVKDIDGVRHHPEGLNYNMQSNGDLHQVYGGEIDKDGNVTLMGLAYNGGDVHVRSSGAPYGKGGDTGMSFGTDSYSKDNPNVIPFGGFPDERGIIPAGRPAADYGQLYNQSSVHIPGAGHEKELDASNPGAVANTPQVVKQKSETVSKNKQESKANKKESPNSFPTNVRSLISTGMLDGVPVKYVSAAREVKDSIYC